MKFTLPILHFVFFFLTVIYSCKPDNKKKVEPITSITKIAELTPLFQNDTIILFFSETTEIEVTIKVPKIQLKGTILALPGWNYPASHWCDSTELCQLASEMGYLLILPTTGKTIYQNDIYPETRKDWKGEITRKWFSETLIKELQIKYHLLLPEQSNYILGLSTGGRGALFIALENPYLFKAGASLSGDFKPELFKIDNLYRGFFGKYEANKERWEQLENPLSRIDELVTPFYIGHGIKDKIVSKTHSEVLYEALQFNNSGNKSILHLDSTAIHNYDYWSSEISTILTYFKEY